METTSTLICIPDISGFTEFMSNTDIELSAKIIPALLNNIIYANEIGLKVSEIEGDAILFYRTGNLPAFSILINQCKTFFTAFYKKLNEIKVQHKKRNALNDIPDVLGLKIILHYGEEVGAVQIGKSIKLMGEDVIIAHRLLKNNIPDDEYLLLSENLLKQYPEKEIKQKFEWGELHDEDKNYKHIGAINYSYITLHRLIG